MYQQLTSAHGGKYYALSLFTAHDFAGGEKLGLSAEDYPG